MSAPSHAKQRPKRKLQMSDAFRVEQRPKRPDGSTIFKLSTSSDWTGIRQKLDGSFSGTTDKPFQGLGGKTALHVAVEFCAPHPVILSLLEYEPTATSAADKFGDLPLHVAALTSNDLDTVRSLVGSYPPAVTAQNRNGNTPLHYAVKRMQEDGFDWVASSREVVEVVRIFIASDPDGASIVNRDRQTALHLACRQRARGSLTLVRLLAEVQPGAVRMKDFEGSTPLHLACRIDYDSGKEMVRVLIEADKREASSCGDATTYSSTLRMQDDEGRTPLHCAIFWFASRGIVNVLIEACPEAANMEDREGFKPLEGLCVIYHHELSEFFRVIENDDDEEELIDHGLNGFWQMAAVIISMLSYGIPSNEIGGLDEDVGDYKSLLHGLFRLKGCPYDIVLFGIHLRRYEVDKEDTDGNLPLHAAAETRTSILAPDGDGDVGRFLREPTPFSRIIETLVDIYPAATRVPNREGMLPLSLMIRSGKTWWRGGIKAVLCEHPGAIMYEDICLGAIPSFLSKMAEPDIGATSMFSLLRAAPSLVQVPTRK